MLTERQRAVLVQELGEEVAEILMVQSADDLVTKDFLRAELAEVRGALYGEMADFRVEVADRFRQQTVWLSTAVFAAVGVSTTLAAIVS